MDAGHPHIPPPEFDPREVEALRALTAQNHRNAQRQASGLGWIVRRIWAALRWPVRTASARWRRPAECELDSTD